MKSIYRPSYSYAKPAVPAAKSAPTMYAGGSSSFKENTGGSFTESGSVPGQSYNYTSPTRVTTPYVPTPSAAVAKPYIPTPAVTPVVSTTPPTMSWEMGMPDAWNKAGYVGDPTGTYSPVDLYAKRRLQTAMSGY